MFLGAWGGACGARSERKVRPGGLASVPTCPLARHGPPMAPMARPGLGPGTKVPARPECTAHMLLPLPTTRDHHAHSLLPAGRVPRDLASHAQRE